MSTLRRFFCAPVPAVGETALLPADEATHAARILRVRPGDAIGLLDGAGVRGVATVTAADPGKRARIAARVEQREVVAPPAVAPVLCVAPPRPKLMSLLVRQATELGVRELRPVLCARAAAPPAAGALAGWEADAREACKQSGNPFLPRLLPPAPFAAALAECALPGYFGWVPTAPAAATPAAPPPVGARSGAVALWIGPEGGFTDVEVAALQAQGLLPLALGPWVLRIETAVVAGLSWLQVHASP